MKTKFNTPLICMLLVIFITTNCCKSAIEIHEKSGHHINLDETKDLYENYNKKIKKEIEAYQNSRTDIKRNKQFNSTEYALISIQELEYYIKFLKEVEKLNKDKNNNEITGIAIFLGAHNNTKVLDSIPKFNYNIENFNQLNSLNNRENGDIRGRMTVFFAPTYKATNDGTNEFEKHKPFYIIPDSSENKYIGTYTNLYNYLQQNQNTSSRSIDNSNGTSLNSNEFNTMPPKD